MVHMDRISMEGIHGVHAIRFQARACAPDLTRLVQTVRGDGKYLIFDHVGRVRNFTDRG
jgi:hypothetical protein